MPRFWHKGTKGLVRLRYISYTVRNTCIECGCSVVVYIVSVVEEPEFTDVIQNVTVPAGRSVRLACSVKNLGSYKVSEHYF